jgi:hypothetical protein
MSIIGLVVFIILVGLLFWVVRTLAAALDIPAPIQQVLYVLLVVVCVLYLPQVFGVLGGGPEIRLR